MMLNILLILIGFVVLIVGAGFIVDGASTIAAKLKVPNIVIGLTIVAFGTSAPEMVVNLFAAINGNSQIVLGNVLGSNIFNVALILGICAIITPLTVKTKTTWNEIPLSFLAAVVVVIIANDVYLDKSGLDVISRSEGIVLLLFFSIFLVYNIHNSLSGEAEEEVVVKPMTTLKASLLFVAGLAMLIVGGKLIVDKSVVIALQLGLSERIIALTIVSIGTSLPELATSVMAVRKKNVDIAIGNVVGSNIFNIFFVLGVSSFVSNVPIVKENQFDLMMNLLLGLLLFLFVFTGKGRRIERWEGILFVLSYLGYMVFILTR
jgi:cation:H+ antiporter